MKHLTWNQITTTYPDQWIGLKDVQEDGSAVVADHTSSFEDLMKNPDLTVKYTTPINEATQSDRMTCEQLRQKYPNQCLGITKIEWENESTVKSAVVQFSDKTRDELMALQIQTNAELECFYTYSIDDVMFLGVQEALQEANNETFNRANDESKRIS